MDLHYNKEIYRGVLSAEMWGHSSASQVVSQGSSGKGKAQQGGSQRSTRARKVNGFAHTSADAVARVTWHKIPLPVATNARLRSFTMKGGVLLHANSANWLLAMAGLALLIPIILAPSGQ